MDREVVAIFIHEGGRLFSELIRTRSIVRIKREEPRIESNSSAIPTKEKAKDIATGCVPCSLGHLGTCTGVLNEAMRFARSDGVRSDEVIDRIGMCTDELNSLERIDLRPEMIAELDGREKDLAVKALDVSRSARHSLEAISSVDDLEQAAAAMQSAKTELARGWYKQLPRPDKEELTRRIIETIEEDK